MSTTTPEPTVGVLDPDDRSAATAQYDLLAPLAPAGLDLVAARARVESAAGRRRTTRRVLAGSCAAVVVIGAAAAFGLLGGNDPADIVADGDVATERTTTTTAPTTTVDTAPTETSVLPTAETLPIESSTTTVPVTTAAPAVTEAPTTVPVGPTPNQAMTAQLTAVTPQVQAGELAEIDLSWRDADLAGGTPLVTVDWADPAVAVLRPTSTGGTCDAPGSPAGGSDRLRFRFATPGTHVVQVLVSTCDGVGPYAERVPLSATIVVTEPAAGLERVLVASTPRLGTPVTPSLDEAVAELVGGDGTITALAARRPLLQQFTSGGPATVLRLPAGAVGTVRLSWPGSPCTATAAVDLAAVPPERTATVELRVSC